MLTPTGRGAHRQATLEAIRAYNSRERAARTWPIQFLIRRIGYPVMDHAWEMEDRDLGGLSKPLSTRGATAILHADGLA